MLIGTKNLRKRVVKFGENLSPCSCSMRFELSAASEGQIEGSTSKAKRRAISGTAMKQMGEISSLSPDCNK